MFQRRFPLNAIHPNTSTDPITPIPEVIQRSEEDSSRVLPDFTPGSIPFIVWFYWPEPERIDLEKLIALAEYLIKRGAQDVEMRPHLENPDGPCVTIYANIHKRSWPTARQQAHRYANQMHTMHLSENPFTHIDRVKRQLTERAGKEIEEHEPIRFF